MSSRVHADPIRAWPASGSPASWRSRRALRVPLRGSKAAQVFRADAGGAANRYLAVRRAGFVRGEAAASRCERCSRSMSSLTDALTTWPDREARCRRCCRGGGTAAADASAVVASCGAESSDSGRTGELESWRRRGGPCSALALAVVAVDASIGRVAGQVELPWWRILAVVAPVGFAARLRSAGQGDAPLPVLPWWRRRLGGRLCCRRAPSLRRRSVFVSRRVAALAPALLAAAACAPASSSGRWARLLC